MTKQERMDTLEEVNLKLDKIISMLSDKRNSELSIQFTKANPNADDSEMKSYEMEIYSMLDKK